MSGEAEPRELDWADMESAVIGALAQALAQGVLEVREMAADLLERWGGLDEKARLTALKEIERRAWLLERTAAEAPPPEPRLASLTSLTKRELEVLQALAEVGSTTKAAAKLHLSPSTVRSHVKRILGKLGMHSRIEAVAFALRHHLIHPRARPPTDR